jgi:hypothetical protein
MTVELPVFAGFVLLEQLFILIGLTVNDDINLFPLVQLYSYHSPRHLKHPLVLLHIITEKEHSRPIKQPLPIFDPINTLPTDPLHHTHHFPPTHILPLLLFQPILRHHRPIDQYCHQQLVTGPFYILPNNQQVVILGFTLRNNLVVTSTEGDLVLGFGLETGQVDKFGFDRLVEEAAAV